MPNFIASSLKPAPYSSNSADVKFAWSATGRNCDLLLTKVYDEEFFLLIKKRDEKSYVIKGEKLTKPAKIGLLQKALIEFKQSNCVGVISESMAIKKTHLTAQKSASKSVGELLEILKAKNIKIVKSNLFENVSFKEFDIIISNPPYISRDEIDVMSENTLTWEPEEALFAENEGLYFYNEICDKGYDYLQKEGYLLFEIGYKQGEKVKMIMENKGYKEIEIIKDLQGLDRVVVGRK